MKQSAPILLGVFVFMAGAASEAAAQTVQVRQAGSQTESPRNPELVAGGGGGSPIRPNSVAQHLHLNLLLDSGTNGPESDASFGDADQTAASVPNCPADIDHDHAVTISDLLTFLDLLDAGSPRADLSRDAAVDAADLFVFLDAFDRGC